MSEGYGDAFPFGSLTFEAVDRSTGTMLRRGSPLVGIFGAIAVMAVLLLLAYEFRISSSGTPAASNSAVQGTF